MWNGCQDPECANAEHPTGIHGGRALRCVAAHAGAASTVDGALDASRSQIDF
jgi:hypothetical protein